MPSELAEVADCTNCLTAIVNECGHDVPAGEGCPTCGWGGYWLCECGHCTRHHNGWWDDDNGHCGMGCDRCACEDCK